MLPRLCFTQTNPFAVGHRNEIKIGHLRRACRTRTAIVTAAEGTGQLHRAPPASPHRQDGTADRSPSQGLSVLPRWTLPWLSSAEQRHFSRAGRAAARRCAQGTAPAGAFAPSRQRPGAAESTALPTRGRSHRGLSASCRDLPLPGPSAAAAPLPFPPGRGRPSPLGPPRKGGPGAEPAWSGPRPTASPEPWAALFCCRACSSRPSAAASAGPTWTSCSTSRRLKPIATAASCRSGREGLALAAAARGRGWRRAGFVAGCSSSSSSSELRAQSPQGSSGRSCPSPWAMQGWARCRQRLRDAVCVPLQWDPMITTLPGLYLLSVGVVKPAAWLLGWTESVVCSVGMLRFINLLFSAGNFYLLYLLLFKIHQKNKVRSK